MDINSFLQFVRKTFKTESDFIPLHEPRFIGNEKLYVCDAIDSTFVSSVGEYVDELEKMIQTISNTKKAIAVVNGTAALQVALRLAGVRKSEEVITQALTFVATANAIAYNNAEPVFLDVDLDTMGLSPTFVEAFLEENGELREDGCYNKKTGKRIAACMPMHTYGFPVHLNELLKVCDTWKIPVIEDAAESFGSLYNGKPTGSLGKFGVYSFNGNKIVTAGGGGTIITNDIELGNFGKHLTTTAKKAHPFEYYHDHLGYNYRMPNLNAALICAQLELIDEFVENKRALAAQYKSYFDEIGVNFRTETPGTKANYWLMCVELDNKDKRDIFLKETNKKGVMTRPIWQLMYKLPMYEHCFRDEQKNTKYLEDRIVNIPSSVIIDG